MSPPAGPQPLVLKLDGKAKALRLRIRGDLDFESAQRLDRLLDHLGDLRGHTLILDFDEVAYVDSTGLSALVSAKLRGDLEGFDVFIARVPPQLQRMLKITGLDRLLLRVPARLRS